MNSNIKSFLKPGFQFVMLAAFALLLINVKMAMTESADQAADVTISQNGLIVTPMSTSVTSIMLRIADPQGRVICDINSEGVPITWSPEEDAQDGVYKYEVRVGFGTRNRTRNEEEQSSPQPRPWRKSGTVFIRNGAIVPPSYEETGLMEKLSSLAKTALTELIDFMVPPVYADQVFADDVIIQGSLGVGVDSSNGQNFGFDTILLKENNLRIFFDDTSNTESYPRNDWRIIINDSVNGGASYFAVEDSSAGKVPFKIEAGAPADSLYIENYGRIGIGTAMPVVELHIADSDTPSVRLEQDWTGGWTPQTWDIAGNETNFFIRDVTNGSKLPFIIRSGAPSNSLFINNTGKVGIGTQTPSEALHVNGNAYVSANLELGSSRAYKKNIQPLAATDAMDTLRDLQPVRYQYKSDPDEETLGFIAEDVPDLVATNSRKSLSPMDLVAVLAKVAQEQQKVIEDLSRKVDRLERDLKARPVDVNSDKTLWDNRIK